jgi:hypothetical protein
MTTMTTHTRSRSSSNNNNNHNHNNSYNKSHDDDDDGSNDIRECHQSKEGPSLSSSLPQQPPSPLPPQQQRRIFPSSSSSSSSSSSKNPTTNNTKARNETNKTTLISSSFSSEQQHQQQQQEQQQQQQEETTLCLSSRGLVTDELDRLLLLDEVSTTTTTTTPFSLSNVTCLDLSRNKLTCLPPSLFLRLLSSPTASSSLSSLSFLGAKSSFSSSLQSSLLILNLNRNSLKRLPPEIALLTQLVEIHALSNHLKWQHLPLVEMTQQLLHLQVLDLRYNPKLYQLPPPSLLLGVSQNNDDGKSSTTLSSLSAAAAAAASSSSSSFLLDKIRITPRKRPKALVLVEQQQHSTSPPPLPSPSLKDDDDDDETLATPKQKPLLLPPALPKKVSAADRDATQLRSQLEPLSTPQLRKRLERSFGIDLLLEAAATAAVAITSNKNDDSTATQTTTTPTTMELAHDREHVMKRLLAAYQEYFAKTATATATGHGNGSDNNVNNSNSNSVIGGGRRVRHERGIPVDPEIVQGLLEELEHIAWPITTRERPKVDAEGYLILQRPPPPSPLPALNSTTTTTISSLSSSSSSTTIIILDSKSVNHTTTTATTQQFKSYTPYHRFGSKRAAHEAKKLQRYHGIWTKAVAALATIDPDFVDCQLTALAVTKNFRGSPHIDTLNVAPFYGICVGNFKKKENSSSGGTIAVECSALEVAEVDTYGRFAKIDGRFPHWVTDYNTSGGGARYSLIYYVTHGTLIPQTTAIFDPRPQLRQQRQRRLLSGRGGMEKHEDTKDLYIEDEDDDALEHWEPPETFVL